MAHAPTRFRPLPGARRGRPARCGMTLMELMVSVSILAGMILAFNVILSQSQRVVSGAQRSIRANSSGMAIAQVIRRDFRSISKDGFLYIGQDTDASRVVSGGTDKRPVVIFTTAGLSESVTGNARGTGSLICYRAATNTVTSDDDILCRIGLVLSTEASTSPVWAAGDRWGTDLADINKMTEVQIKSGIVTPLEAAMQLTIPPNSASDIASLWKVLAHNVRVVGGSSTDLKIEYSLPNELGTWRLPPVAGVTWTYRNQDAWPVAIKFRLTMGTSSEVRRALRDTENPDNAVDYEVICPIGN